MSCGDPHVQAWNFPHIPARRADLCPSCANTINIGDTILLAPKGYSVTGLVAKWWVCKACAEQAHIRSQGGSSGHGQGTGTGGSGTSSSTTSSTSAGTSGTNPGSFTVSFTSQGTSQYVARQARPVRRQVGAHTQQPSVWNYQPELTPIKQSRVPIIGYRAWVLDRNLPVLRSINAGTIWRAGEQIARCTTTAKHRAPCPQCRCGLYARFNFWTLMEYISKDYRVVEEDGSVVFGIVALYGLILPGTTGVRAEKSNTLALWATPDSRTPATLFDARMDAIGRLYGVPIAESQEQMEEWANEHRAMWEMEAAAAEAERVPDTPEELTQDE